MGAGSSDALPKLAEVLIAVQLVPSSVYVRAQPCAEVPRRDEGLRAPYLGRDSALCSFAERDGWRQLAMVHGSLRPLSEIVLDNDALDACCPSAGSRAALLIAGHPTSAQDAGGAELV